MGSGLNFANIPIVDLARQFGGWAVFGLMLLIVLGSVAKVALKNASDIMRAKAEIIRAEGEKALKEAEADGLRRGPMRVIVAQNDADPADDSSGSSNMIDFKPITRMEALKEWLRIKNFS
jgi:hypothetical protein